MTYQREPNGQLMQKQSSMKTLYVNSVRTDHFFVEMDEKVTFLEVHRKRLIFCKPLQPTRKNSDLVFVQGCI